MIEFLPKFHISFPSSEVSCLLVKFTSFDLYLLFSNSDGVQSFVWQLISEIILKMFSDLFPLITFFSFKQVPCSAFQILNAISHDKS